MLDVLMDKTTMLMAAAEKAVSMGGPMSGVFQNTLEEIKSSLSGP